MGANFNNCLELLQGAVDKGLYGKLVEQISKDFELANVSMNLFKNNALNLITAENLIKSLHEKIYFLIMERFSDYLNVLYIVDVPEKSFKDLPLTDVVEFAEHVTFLVLQRDWQKVQLKRRYTS